MNAKLIQYSTIASRDSGNFRWLPVGMGYLIMDKCGRCIAVDGGNPEDALDFSTLIAEYTDTVDIWILTHPHPDHYGALTAISQDASIKNKIAVNKIAVSLPSFDSKYALEHENYEETYNMIMGLGKQLSCDIITPTANDIFNVGDMCVKILFTQDEYREAGDPNELSTIFSVDLENVKILFTGDTYPIPAEMCAKKCENQLKCDICQIAHHGLNGGDSSMYAYAAPKICLIPTAKAAYEAMLFGDYKENNATKANRLLMQKVASENHIISAFGTKTILINNGNITIS